jgi:XTP/dITP diphosphohydrolase
VATHNPHKIEEISALIGGKWDLRTLAEVQPPVTWVESGSTFLENAMIKVQAARQVLPGRLLVGEDSGLCVDFLKGAPGIYSSRYGGEEGNHPRNCAKLLEALAEVPPGQRRAHFYCLLVYMDAAGAITSFAGRCDGEITLEARGKNGFGYDPIFRPMGGGGLSMAELSAAEKHRLSHRAKAFALWQQWMAPQQ